MKRGPDLRTHETMTMVWPKLKHNALLFSYRGQKLKIYHGLIMISIHKISMRHTAITSVSNEHDISPWPERHNECHVSWHLNDKGRYSPAIMIRNSYWKMTIVISVFVIKRYILHKFYIHLQCMMIRIIMQQLSQLNCEGKANDAYISVLSMMAWWRG